MTRRVVVNGNAGKCYVQEVESRFACVYNLTRPSYYDFVHFAWEIHVRSFWFR